MVIWSRRAKANLKAIYQTIAKDSPMNAEKVVNEMRDMVLPLEDLPYRGIVVPEVKVEQLRQIPAYSWRIVYHIRSNNEIFIVAVAHKRQVFDASYFKV